MPITINGSGTLTGVSVGGLPDGVVDADTLATDAVTTVKIQDDAVTDAKQDLSGAAKAWFNVNQTGTQALIDSFNVASITDIGVGQTTITFTNNMPNANYAIVIGAATTGAYSDWSGLQGYYQTTVETSGFSVLNADENDNFYDTNSFSAAVFGG